MVVEVSFVNVVATASLDQKVDLYELGKLREFLHDPDIYRGMVAYHRSPSTQGTVSVFTSGKMIIVGAKSEEEASNGLEYVKDFLVERGVVKPTILKHKIQNIVAVADLKTNIDLEKIAERKKIIYEPEQFPGAIYRMEDPHVVFLIFSTGKLVCVGARNEDDVYRAAENLLTMLQDTGVLIRVET